MRAGLLLFAASAVLACRPTHANEPPKHPPAGPFPEAATKIWDKGLADGWEDWGWAPRKLEAGQPARLDMGHYGGWILAHRKLEGHWGGVRIRYRAPAGYGEFLEVRVDSDQSVSYPRVALDVAHQLPAADGWTDAFIPMGELDPHGQPFDRIILRAYRDVGHDPVELASVAFTHPDPANEKPVVTKRRSVTLTVDCRAATHEISPLIYGIAYGFQKDTSGPLRWSLGATARRWGGNPASRYNWKLGNAWNTASDWFFQNVNYTGLPNYTYQHFLDDDLKHNVATALTVPTLGWVAKDTTSYTFPVSRFGAQAKTAPEQQNAGNGVDTNGKPIVPPGPSQTSVPAPPEFIGEWVKAIRAHEKPGVRSVQMYILDNEPMLWNTTHRDVHPAPVSYDELLERTIGYAKAIKAADPQAIIAGPAEWGWPAYQYSAVDAQEGYSFAPDRLRHGNVPLIPWWLRKLHEYKQKNGVNLVDVLDVHFYPQADGMGVGTDGKVDAATAAKRIRSTRALWDPTYVDESWIKQPVMLLPRLKKWIDENNPGMGISIGEWNFGAENDVSGGLAVAETLGRFENAGITSAFYWTSPPDGSPAYWAFRAYRNYDEHGAHFLDTSVPGSSSDKSASVFASRDSSGKLVLVALNLDPESELDADVELEGCAAPSSARAFSYVGGLHGFQPAPDPLQGRTVHAALSPYSINVLELHAK
ncbi:MAG: glycosyl hydrolase [Deltaproteobacteria bacterium]|nr:glycosyl hydrolase [Deltaproteobacteria bacterium]